MTAVGAAVVHQRERRARILHRRAEVLLAESRLLPQLRRYGEVSVGGSYALDLMTHGDIDLHVWNPKMTERRVLQALLESIRTRYFRGHLYYDFTKRRHRGFPKGWYVGLKKRLRGEKWTVDIWFTKTPRQTHRQLPAPFDRQTRLSILKLKAIRDERKTDIPSWDIYQAVVYRHVRTWKQLEESLKKDGSI